MSDELFTDSTVSELRPRLIASTHTINPIFELSTGALYSIDNLRYKVEGASIEAVCKLLDFWPGLHYVDTYTSNRIGSYRYMWVWKRADAVGDGMDDDEGNHEGNDDVVIKAGYGLVRPSGKVDNVGFLDFNPNKCEGKGKALIRRLMGAGCDMELVRYDLAIDFEVKRDLVRLVKDRRKWEAHCSNGLTEYLGQRNHPGRVKVYDKKAESDLEFECTRVELTCKSEWSADDVMQMLPVVFYPKGANFNGFKGVTKAFALLAMDMCERKDEFGNPGFLVPYLRMVDAKTRTKINKAIREDSARLEYDRKSIEMAKRRADSFLAGY